MSRQKRFDPDLPPSKREDWVGAVVHIPKSRLAPAKRGGMIFHVFKSKKNSDLFVITDGSSPDQIASLRAYAGSWTPLKVLPETGKPRIGFSERSAKEAIRAKGYQLIRMSDTGRVSE
jgi:hypothetical protein